MKPVNEKRQDEQYVSYQPSTLTIVSRVGLLLLVLLLTRTSYAQRIGADEIMTNKLIAQGQKIKLTR